MYCTVVQANAGANPRSSARPADRKRQGMRVRRAHGRGEKSRLHDSHRGGERCRATGPPLNRRRAPSSSSRLSSEPSPHISRGPSCSSALPPMTRRGRLLLLLGSLVGGARASQSCSNTCSYADDGGCDDGGPGRDYSLCSLGTDCQDLSLIHISEPTRPY